VKTVIPELELKEERTSSSDRQKPSAGMKEGFFLVQTELQKVTDKERTLPKRKDYRNAKQANNIFSQCTTTTNDTSKR
jgi:hypothetical protein